MTKLFSTALRTALTGLTLMATAAPGLASWGVVMPSAPTALPATAVTAALDNPVIDVVALQEFADARPEEAEEALGSFVAPGHSPWGLYPEPTPEGLAIDYSLCMMPIYTDQQFPLPPMREGTYRHAETGALVAPAYFAPLTQTMIIEPWGNPDFQAAYAGYSHNGATCWPGRD